MIQIDKMCKENNVSSIPLLEGSCDRVSLSRVEVRPGNMWEPELYPFPETTQMILFLRGKGYVAADIKAYNICGPALFVPGFDREKVRVSAAGGPLVCLRIVSRMNEEDCAQIKKSHMVFPRFRPFSQAWEHTMNTIDDPGSNTRAFVLIENRKLGANNMGIFRSEPGIAKINADILPAYDQFVIGLEGACCTLYAGNESAAFGEGDVAFIPRNTEFRFDCGESGRIHHLWYSLNRAYDQDREG